MLHTFAKPMALLAAAFSVGFAYADVVVKDTLDPANFTDITWGGGYIHGHIEINAVDGRTFIGFENWHRGKIAELTVNFNANAEGNNEPFPINGAPPHRSGLFDLNVALYSSFAEATGNETRVDAFLPESLQPQDIFSNAVGTTTGEPTGSLNKVADVYQATYDLRGYSLVVSRGSTNYLGISATGTPAGIAFGLQRSSDSGIVIGSDPDYLRSDRVPIIPPGLTPMSDYFADSIQNSVRITITNFGDARDGDYNGDGVVDAADFTVWRDNYGATSGPGLVADGNVDGVVDASDYAVWREYYGETVPGSVPADSLTVPEPTAIVLVGLVFGLAVLRRTDR